MTYEEEFGNDEVSEDQLSLTSESDPKYIVYLDNETDWKILETPNGHLSFEEATKIAGMKNKTNLTRGLNLDS